ncbi:unnamed protein product [Spirodela intermedia]|uniref:Flavin-containing monooxygenase n=1 Tax=Spirodela intermedia TaxID=51605 RepID=A0A7I8J8A4_SPIIN|nr:unnamed protein product [Spirodela intermedia]CAA6666304.1 unnamed protein product [Spirodela intermedia]
MCSRTERDAEGLQCTLAEGPIVVGAGPSGLAVAACLANLGVPSTHRTYDRLKLHLPKQFCELPLMGFPAGFPKYPSKHQFVAYMEAYAARFGIRPIFGRAVEVAEFDAAGCCWRVVAQTGENAQPNTPELPGLERFGGRVIHTSSYKSGRDFRGENVLVVGCGNSGMEVSFDLCRHYARPHMVVRNSVHVLPREVLGVSTFGIAMALLKWLPLKAVDRILLAAAHIILGDTDRVGLRRPKTGPIELKNSTGKTPVLDVGALAHIRAGKIKVSGPPHPRDMSEGGDTDGRPVPGRRRGDFDSIILATGYKSNVPSWLKGGDLFTKEGLPNKPFPNGWRGEDGLYSVGFTMRGLQGTSSDAINIAADISEQWRSGAVIAQGGGSTHRRPHCQRPPPSTQGAPAAAV